MFSFALTLNDFICSIPICQSGTDLGNILNIFHQTDCSSIAISQKDKTWGIISSQKLLALLAKSWQTHSMARVGHPRNPYYSELAPKIENFNSLIEPAIIYRSDTPIVEFFSRLDLNSLHFSQEVYLISDRKGQLKGKLDLAKLLKYVSLKFNHFKTDSNSSTLFDPTISLIDSITLPLKIETSQGKDIYRNKCWQKLVSQGEDRHSAVTRSDVSIANWWVQQQLNNLRSNTPVGNDLGVSTSNNNPNDYCCLDAQYYPRHQLDALTTETSLSKLNLELTQQSNSLLKNRAKSSLKDTCLQPASDRGIKIESGTRWTYLKIPTTIDNPQQLSNSNTNTYWLVLAIELATAESKAFESQDTLDSSLTVDELLGTIAHELKSPLTGIVGLSSLLKAQKLGTLNQSQTNYVELIYNGGQKLMSIVKDLLEVTNLTTAKVDLQPELIDLESWCAQLYQQVITKLKSKDGQKTNFAIVPNQLQIEIEPGRETAIADRRRLSSILSHLTIEAIHCSKANPILKIKIQSQADGLAIAISNNYPASATPLSEPNHSSINSGVQLNLTIARYIAKTLEGEIESINTSQGCQFTLLLPQKESQPSTLTSNSKPKQDDSDRAKSPKNLTILCLYPEPEVVDPQLLNHKELNLDLKQWVEQDWADPQQKFNYRYRIIEADGLEQAHTLARIWQLDAIVIDGYQIAECGKYLRSLQQSKHLSVLPLITLDTKTTEAANQVEGLNVYPCLLPAQCRNIKDLIQVIQIATGK